MSTDTFGSKLIEDALTFGIIGFFVLFIISKFTKRNLKEVFEMIKELFKGKEEE